MKHIAPVTKTQVVKAGEWQDFVCMMAQVLNNILGFFGGASPLLSYVADKCTIPTANDESQ